MATLTIDRSRLNQQLVLAQRRQDEDEIRELRRQLNEIDAEIAAHDAADAPREETLTDKLAKVNERNRKANAESIRAAELREMERRRKEKLAAANGSATPPTTFDPSARLKTVPKLFNPRLVSSSFSSHRCSSLCLSDVDTHLFMLALVRPGHTPDRLLVHPLLVTKPILELHGPHHLSQELLPQQRAFLLRSPAWPPPSSTP